jgi:SAM-dependent MidA family methyltransferase
MMLINVLIDIIKAQGSIPLYEYMKLCQTHPEFGYYTTKPADQILGNKGDFITSPEISSLFGEMIAFWVVLQWERMGCPSYVVLLELGGGRGVLMRDIVKTLQRLPSFSANYEVHSLEINPDFQRLQKKELSEIKEVFHHETLDGLYELKIPLIVIANEFFDALPVQQYIHKEQQWYEVHVGLDADEALTWVYVPCDEAPNHTEIQPDVLQVLDQLYRAIHRRGGAALFIDYGYWEGQGNTLQAVYQHHTVSPLEYSGIADLSVHVDFKNMALKCSDHGLQYNYTTQRKFLMDLGIVLRANQGYNPSSEPIHKAVHRLIDPSEMGHLFKVLEVCGNDE